ncbi:MAG: hypothetical protein PHC88_15090 [Terrimicrobiaceae bacterium]|nr:hypothetical protein [Terrimicrobiaceae bacterium]
MADRFSSSQRSVGRRRSSRDGFGDRDPKPKGGDGLFGWSVFLLLLIGLAALCWMGTLYIFGHPEEPLGYAVLHKFKKLEAPKRFSETAAPKGEFLDARKLLARYGTMTPRRLENESDKLLRDYIRNYENMSGLVPYIVGRFDILDSYQLTKDDFFQSGVVAVAQDSEVPQLIVEHVFTTDERMVPTLHRSLLTGLDIPVQRSINLSPIIHVERLPDGRLKLTTVPIQYPDYSATQGPGGFSLEPPPTLNVEAGLPIVSPGKLAEADERYAAYRRKLANPNNANLNPPSNALVPVRPATATGGQTPEPKIAQEPPPAREEPATPAPVASTPPPAPPAEPRVLPAIPVNGPQPAAVATAPAVGTDVPLKPFMPGNQAATAVASTANGKWQTYKPGQMPRGRLLGMKDARKLAASDLAGERLYLRGDFTVTASVGNSAVLRSAASDPDAAPNTRVVVQFPGNVQPPDQGATVARGEDRPFLVTNVRQTPDGQVNIYVREVTSE